MSELHYLIKDRNFKQALEKLEQEAKDLQYYRLKGLIYFLKEDYTTSLLHLKQASALDSNDIHWEELREQAEQNSFSAINDFVPPIIRVHSANVSARKKMELGIAAIRRLHGR